jgi:8-oxo-dGTP pyrophosphatase MutT (NUDIX family)
MSDIKREYSEIKLARGLIFHQDHVLLAKNNQASGHFFLPGGKVDPLESVPVALAREFQEEIAWAVRPTLFLGCYEHIWQASKKSGALVDVVEINFLWLCEKIDGPLNLENPPSMEEKISFQWVDLKKLDSLHLYPVEMKEILPRLANAATGAANGPGKAFWGTSLKSQVAKH